MPEKSSKVKYPDAAPMSTFREVLWYALSDQNIKRLLMGDKSKGFPDQSSLDTEFQPIYSNGTASIPHRTEIIPDSNREGSMWIFNQEQLNSLLPKITDSMYPLRLCYYKKESE